MARVVVIGGGGAALRAAHAAVAAGADVTLVSKGMVAASGCTYAIDSKIEYSVVNWPMPDPDTASTYAADLASVGRGLKDPARLGLFAERSADEGRLLESLGVSLGARGAYRRVQLAGSSQPRGVVCPPRFGRRVLEALLGAIAPARFTVRDRTMALEILTAGGRATGVLTLDLRTGALATVAADAVVLAAGGAGRLFSLTTNPPDLTGDGYALAWRAGAVLANMEFIQYVMLTVAPIRGYFLLTSVLLRGALADDTGARFAPGADLDVMTPLEQKRLLYEFMTWIADRRGARSPRRVLWDGRGIDRASLERAMPKTLATFRRRGVDLTADPVPLDLGAHQFLGGVVTDLAARSSVPNLFAAGDVADSVQGADRINGSGIMEALVFGALAGSGAAAVATTTTAPVAPARYARRTPHAPDRLRQRRRALAEEIDPLLALRDRTRLAGLTPRLAAELEELTEGGLVGETAGHTRALHELRSALTTAWLVAGASLSRERNLGLFVTA